MQSTIFEITFLGISIAPKWYGFMYAVGFLISYHFVKKWGRLSPKELDALLLYVFFGVVGGGRVGYILLYNFNFFLENPLSILRIWEGGMSFHGGFLGVLIAVAVFSKKYKKSFFSITDTLAIIVPIAIGLGRLGNYINQELLGFSPYSGPFTIVKNGISYFPSPLLEMFLEGMLLFALQMFVANRIGFFSRETRTKRVFVGMLSSLFLMGYGVLRFIAEFFRLPDDHIGYLFSTNWITLGMLYSFPLIAAGIVLAILQKNKQFK